MNDFTGTWRTRGGLSVTILKLKHRGVHDGDFASLECPGYWDQRGNHNSDPALDLEERISEKAGEG